ncbi:MAG: hypothetical protein GX661_02135, partial [Acholeplasmataceae bacterium]|nr:hypothetical protein [Acholeplasmataceae bacterium]
MIMIINLLSCGIIIASAVWGYRLGFHRSFIRLTVFCISVLSGLFFSRIFATLFVNFDLSLFRITNLPGLLSSIIKDYLPGDIIYRSYYIQIIITEITVAILRVAFFTIWAVISIILSMVFPIKKQIRKDSISKRLLGSALGVIQTLLFILLIGSLIKGLTVCFVSEKDAFRKELSNTIPMKVSNYCLYDCLFSITYQNERINLRQDILWFQKNQDLI